MSSAGGNRPRRWSPSLRLRLTAITTVVVVVALTVGALLLTSVLTSSRLAGLSAVAADRSSAIAELVATNRLPSTLSTSYPGEIAQLLDDDGRVITTSPNASGTLPVVPADLLSEMTGATSRDAAVDSARTTTRSPYSTEPVQVVVQDARQAGKTVHAVVTNPAQEVYSVVGTVRLSLLFVVPTLAAVWAVACWLLVGRSLRPVDELREAADRVSATGGSGTLPVPRTHDEVTALAVTLNSMLDRLAVAHGRQATFVADAAHELRSPVAALRVTAEVAAEHPGTTSVEELAGEMLPEVLRIQRLVDDLLVLARLGSVERQAVSIDLVDTVDEAVALATATSDGTADVTVSGHGRATADPTAALRIIRNLVDNAIRHADGVVRIRVADGRVSVRDDGPGIDEADRARVFERFTRLEASRHRDAGGSGLGLAIARGLARDMGGDVVLADRRDTEFIVEFPPDAGATRPVATD